MSKFTGKAALAALALACIGGTSTMKAQNTLPTLYGSVIYSDDWENIQGWSKLYGYYSFQPTSNPTLSKVMLDPNLYVNGGGCYSDRKIHYHIWEMYADEDSDTGITFNDFYCVVNTDRWEYEQDPIRNSVTDAYVTYDMTYDPTTGNIYALNWGPYEDTYCNLAVVNPDSGESSDVGRLNAMCVLAANNFGQLFSVDYDGTVYYLDKQTGEAIPLGNSGVKPKYMQSATVDPETNTIYWTATLANGDGILYTIDTTTGALTQIARMPGNAEVTGLFIEADRKGLDAPAPLSDFIVNYTDGKSRVSFTIPSKGFDGSALSGTINAYVYVDGKQVVAKSGQPGENVTAEFDVTDGQHTIVAYAANAAGEGVKTYRRQVTGKDVPAAPTNVRLSIAGGRATLTWEDPKQGLNGGAFDPEDLTYTIVRYPGAQTVAMAYRGNTFSEKLPEGTATYYYDVTAYCDGEEGGTATSNTEFVGTAYTVPYTLDFEADDSMKDVTIIVNEEGRGWYRWENKPLDFKAAASKFNMNTQSDHWMILPAIQLEGGKKYTLSFRERVFSNEDPEKFEVTIGTDPMVAAQTKTLLNVVTVKNEEWLDYNLPITITESGLYNIAFHCVSPAYAYYLIIDDITVTGDQSGVEAIDPDDTFSVSTANGSIMITGAEGEIAYLYSIDGQLLGSTVCAATTSFSVQGGLYIVRVGDKAVKVRI